MLLHRAPAANIGIWVPSADAPAAGLGCGAARGPSAWWHSIAAVCCEPLLPRRGERAGLGSWRSYGGLKAGGVGAAGVTWVPSAPREAHSRLWVIITPKHPGLLLAKMLQSRASRGATQEAEGRGGLRTAREAPPPCSFCVSKRKKPLDFRSSVLASGLSKRKRDPFPSRRAVAPPAPSLSLVGGFGAETGVPQKQWAHTAPGVSPPCLQSQINPPVGHTGKWGPCTLPTWLHLQVGEEMGLPAWSSAGQEDAVGWPVHVRMRWDRQTPLPPQTDLPAAGASPREGRSIAGHWARWLPKKR